MNKSILLKKNKHYHQIFKKLEMLSPKVDPEEIKTCCILKIIVDQETSKERVSPNSNKPINNSKLPVKLRGEIKKEDKIKKLKPINSGDISYFDKIDTKNNYEESGIRVVPPGVVRYGAYCEPGVIIMPSYVNIGAYVGSGTMIDTWATIGSCAQVGKNVHISGGVGIGGVLEPPSAMPVIIEDNAFIGSRCIVVEGVKVCEGAVLGANVTLTSSTPIIDVTGSEPIEYKGVVPENSVVISGTRPKEFPSGTFQTTCALIIGKRKE